MLKSNQHPREKATIKKSLIPFFSLFPSPLLSSLCQCVFQPWASNTSPLVFLVSVCLWPDLSAWGSSPLHCLLCTITISLYFPFFPQQRLTDKAPLNPLNMGELFRSCSRMFFLKNEAEIWHNFLAFLFFPFLLNSCFLSHPRFFSSLFIPPQSLLFASSPVFHWLPLTCFHAWLFFSLSPNPLLSSPFCWVFLPFLISSSPLTESVYLVNAAGHRVSNKSHVLHIFLILLNSK